jgi:hypothetical protein
VAHAPAAPTLTVHALDNFVFDRPMFNEEVEQMIELQRRAEESIRVAEASQPANITSLDARPMTARAADLPRMAAPEVSLRDRAGVQTRRVTVPSAPAAGPSVVARVAVTAPVPVTTLPARVAPDEVPMSSMNPMELRNAFRRTFMSENEHLSTFQIDDRFDIASDFDRAFEGFTAARDLSEDNRIRPLEIRIGFRGNDAALTRDNFTLLSEYARTVVANPRRAIQISIPENLTGSLDGRRLAARRLAIIEQVLRDTGVCDTRIMPVLAARNDESFVLRIISSDQFETMTQQRRDMFGDVTNVRTQRAMSW